MNRTLTFSDLLYLAYDNPNYIFDAELRTAIEQDIYLRQELEMIEEAKNLLDGFEEMSPSEESVNNILNYSKSLEVKKSDFVGRMCVCLN
jgi:DNA-binding transcriptional regulator LsrR (DeoR family)